MRSEDDQWGIAESVGVTALGVASGRAMETKRADGLVSDPYAASFVHAAADEVPLPADPADDDGDVWSVQSAYIGVRSRFFDRLLIDAAASGIRQIVLLAAGLDARALRLDWPAGTTVYEVDQSGVLDFKDGVLHDTPESATRVVVPVDLRHDWPAALREAGFDPDRPTAWLAEGLLPYLPAQAEADLFDRVQQLSAPGSRLAVEDFADALGAFSSPRNVDAMSERLGVDVRELFFDDERPGVTDRLRARGWTVTGDLASDLATAWGRPLDGAPMGEVYGQVHLLDATLGT